MKFFDQGSEFRVTVSDREVDEFNRQWPCSTLDGAQSFTFQKSNGDLVDRAGRGDGSEAVALADDAKRYGQKRLRARARYASTRAVYESLGMHRVRGALGGTYYE